jgi:hypothetical protein
VLTSRKDKFHRRLQIGVGRGGPGG